jgi:pimeloyl-ACP methyl ester carboxylesterase
MPHVRVDGHELHYLRRGAGEPLLLIQGMSGTHVAWGDSFEAALEAAGLELISYDHRGVGQSSTWPTTPPGCSTLSGSRTPTCSASRWAAWSPRSWRCATRAACGR